MEVLEHPEAFQQALLTWYKKAKRPLLWRIKPSLYKTIVSEFMLQQTQVKTVTPYFERWMQLFPDWKTLALADENFVLKQWEGLGYYQRARNLHALAKTITSLSEIPETPDEWKKFKGIGPYTAAAITSIIYNYPAAVVDGNVIRVLSRVVAEKRVFKDNSDATAIITPIAEKLLSKKYPGEYNQAIMELGATLCYRQSPHCTICPVWSHCSATKAGIEELVPSFAEKKTHKVEISRIFCIVKNQLLLHKLPIHGKRLQGIYEIPRYDSIFKDQPNPKLLLLKSSRSITNQRISESFYHGSMKNKKDFPEHEWIPLSELDTITLSGPHRRWLKKLLLSDKI